MNRIRWQTVSLRNPYLFALALLVIILAANLAVQPNLLNSGAINDNMRVFLPTILLAAGQAVAILGGGIDISVGSIVSIINVLLATQLGADASPQKTAMFLGIALLVGAAAGAINGFFVAILRLQPIITTYATSFLYAGVALYVLPEPGGTVPSGIANFYRNVTPLGLSLGFFIILIVLLLWYFLAQTRYGRYLYAMGGKADAAYETGVPVSLVQFSTYVISGLMAAVAGIAITLLVGAGNAGIGDALTLTAITAVVVGGTALSGGIGGLAGPILGAISLGLIHNIISFANVDLWWQTFVNAAIIVVALAMPGAISLARRLRR